jgi:hypothetical protein
MVRYCILIVLGICLNACGKKGPVEPLEPSEYPRTYPKPPPDSDLGKNRKKGISQ